MEIKFSDKDFWDLRNLVTKPIYFVNLSDSLCEGNWSLDIVHNGHFKLNYNNELVLRTEENKRLTLPYSFKCDFKDFKQLAEIIETINPDYSFNAMFSILNPCDEYGNKTREVISDSVSFRRCSDIYLPEDEVLDEENDEYYEPNYGYVIDSYNLERISDLDNIRIKDYAEDKIYAFDYCEFYQGDNSLDIEITSFKEAPEIAATKSLNEMLSDTQEKHDNQKYENIKYNISEFFAYKESSQIASNKLNVFSLIKYGEDTFIKDKNVMVQGSNIGFIVADKDILGDAIDKGIVKDYKDGLNLNKLSDVYSNCEALSFDSLIESVKPKNKNNEEFQY